MRLTQTLLAICAMGLATVGLAETMDSESQSAALETSHSDTHNLNQTEKYLSILGSYSDSDSDRDVDTAYGGRLIFGMPLSQRFSLELGASSTNIKRESNEQRDDFYHTIGPDLVFAPRNRSFSRNHTTPFFLVGAGLVHDDTKNKRDNSLYLNAGLGLLVPLSAHRVRLRAEARYVRFINDSAPGANDPNINKDDFNELIFGLGLQMSFGATTVIKETVVKEVASPIPPAPVQSCSNCDADNDGVQNELDNCPGTRPGAWVNQFGCPADGDNDRVYDAQDRCPNTPYGTAVDSRGCARLLNNDADGDGVINSKDRCPNTLANMEVNGFGCVEKRQTMALRGINFEFDSDRLTAASSKQLRKAVLALRDQPDMVVEIAGHTDSLGDQAYNLRLSERRAVAVRDFMINAGIDATRLEGLGYGELQPVDTNTTEEGRANNRRVEFRTNRR